MIYRTEEEDEVKYYRELEKQEVVKVMRERQEGEETDFQTRG
jgi:hypothetical protein